MASGGAVGSGGSGGTGGIIGSGGAAGSDGGVDSGDSSGIPAVGSGGASPDVSASGGANTGGAISSAAGGMGAGGGAGGHAGGGGRAGSAASGSGGAGGSSAAFRQVANIFGKNCGVSGCHLDKEYPRFGADGKLYGTLTEGTVLAECDYTKLIEPGDPANSALVRLMNRKCGTFVMPPTCRMTPCLSAADLKVLTDWIQSGAPP